MLADRQERDFRHRLLRRALDTLNEVERQIVEHRHLKPRATPLKALGRDFGVSGERIRQMERKTLKKLAKLASAQAIPVAQALQR